MFVINVMVNVIIPADISMYGGMTATDDPVMILFFFYPFIVAFAAAILFDVVKDCLMGTPVQKGLMFGALLLVIMTVPNLYMMITSMTRPIDLFISTTTREIMSFPLRGILFCKNPKTLIKRATVVRVLYLFFIPGIKIHKKGLRRGRDLNS